MNSTRLMVGLEVHQQLDTSSKLFCSCIPTESDEYDTEFVRRLRATTGEMGIYDRAVIFESVKSKTNTYHASSLNSCALERDEMPPRGLDNMAKQIALLIAASLDSTIFPELFVMRKMVIDGSNTSGFQRTMMVSTGGMLDADGIKVAVLGIFLEEDAARLEEKTESRVYNLDRLGVPLVEIVLAPLETDPAGARRMALALGRLLRATRKVRRGLGSIRQDVNVSVMGGAVVEVKGVQQLDQLEKVVAYEEERQMALYELAQRPEIKSMPTITINDIFDVSEIFAQTDSEILRRALESHQRLVCIRARSLAGMIGYEPRAGMRLGREIAQIVKLFGAGGVFHSDELPAYGMTEKEVDMVSQKLGLTESDAFVIVAVASKLFEYVAETIVARLNAVKKGPLAETRVATQDNRTVYLRPRPGSSRMYPETDVPIIPVTEAEIAEARSLVPPSWAESIAQLQSRHSLNAQLAEQLFDSERLDLFEKITGYPNIEGNFAASLILSTITSLQRKGFTLHLPDKEIDAAFAMLSAKKITKESIEIIFEHIMSGKATTAKEYAESSTSMNDDELTETLSRIVSANMDVIASQREHAIGMLMGIAMKELRGKVPGEKINTKLAQLVESAIVSSK